MNANELPGDWKAGASWQSNPEAKFIMTVFTRLFVTGSRGASSPPLKKRALTIYEGLKNIQMQKSHGKAFPQGEVSVVSNHSPPPNPVQSSRGS